MAAWASNLTRPRATGTLLTVAILEVHLPRQISVVTAFACGHWGAGRHALKIFAEQKHVPSDLMIGGPVSVEARTSFMGPPPPAHHLTIRCPNSNPGYAIAFNSSTRCANTL